MVLMHLQGRAEMYDTVVGIGVDPRNIAQRIMDVSGPPACAASADVSERTSMLI